MINYQNILFNPNNKNKLSRRQAECLLLLVDGMSCKEIAFKLKVSVKTVSTHRERLYRKTGVDSILGLAKVCVALGFIDDDYFTKSLLDIKNGPIDYETKNININPDWFLYHNGRSAESQRTDQYQSRQLAQ